MVAMSFGQVGRVNVNSSPKVSKNDLLYRDVAPNGQRFRDASKNVADDETG